MLALDDDTTEFHRRFARDPLLGPRSARCVGYRPLRLADRRSRAAPGGVRPADRGATGGRDRALDPARSSASPSPTRDGAPRALARRPPPARTRDARAPRRSSASSARSTSSGCATHDTAVVLQRLCAGAGHRPVVGRRDRARGPRPLRPRPRRRPRARQAAAPRCGATGSRRTRRRSSSPRTRSGRGSPGRC